MIYAFTGATPRSTKSSTPPRTEIARRSDAHIFLLEDDPSNAKLIQSYLDLVGFGPARLATSLTSAASVLSEYDESSFDLIIMDRMLPDGESLDLAAQIRRAARAPMLAYTARCSFDERQELLKTGFDHVLQKPLGLVDFVSTIDQHFPPVE